MGVYIRTHTYIHIHTCIYMLIKREASHGYIHTYIYVLIKIHFKHEREIPSWSLGMNFPLAACVPPEVS